MEVIFGISSPSMPLNSHQRVFKHFILMLDIRYYEAERRIRVQFPPSYNIVYVARHNTAHLGNVTFASFPFGCQLTEMVVVASYLLLCAPFL